MPKVFLKPIAGVLFLLMVATSLALGQTDSKSENQLSFEVASIRPAGPLDAAAILSGKVRMGLSVDGDRVDISGLPLLALICQAYKLEPYRVAGNPDWLNAGVNAERFDILAKMPQGATKEKVPQMLQALLAERFKLAVHYEKREMSVYVLVVGNGGSKLVEAAPDPGVDAPAAGTPAASSGETGTAPAPKPAAAKGEIALGSGDNRVTMKRSGDGMTLNSKQTGTMRVVPGDNGGMRMEAESMSMESFANTLTQLTDRPVVDITGLKGKYKVAFEVSMNTLTNVARKAGVNTGMNAAPANVPGLPAGAASDPSDGSVFDSVQKLGLKLERRKLPYDFLVIDHVEKTPTEN